jgi:hypothetical protein
MIKSFKWAEIVADRKRKIIQTLGRVIDPEDEMVKKLLGTQEA